MATATVASTRAPTISDLFVTSNQYLNRDLPAESRPTGRELFSEASSWLKGLRARNRSTSNPQGLPARKPRWATPVPQSEESEWLSYHQAGQVGGEAYQFPSDRKDSSDPEHHWQEWNYEEALRQAIDASRDAFDEQRSPTGSHTDDDIERAIAESTATARADAARRADAEREEADLQAAMRESAKAHTHRQPPLRSGTTETEKQEIREAVALSLQDAHTQHSTNSTGPQPSTSALVDSPGYQPSPPPMYEPKIKPLAPPLPLRAPPVPPRPLPIPPRDAPESGGGQLTPTMSSIALDSPPSTESTDGAPSASSHSTSYFAYTAGAAPQSASMSAQLSGSSSAATHGSVAHPPAPTAPDALTVDAEPGRTRSFGDEEAAEFMASFEHSSKWPMDPRGVNLPNGGYRTHSPSQLSCLTEHTEPLNTRPLPTPMSLTGDSTMALEMGERGKESRDQSQDSALLRPRMQQDIPSEATQTSSVYVDANQLPSNPSLAAAAQEIAPPSGPFGEALRFGYECDDEIKALEGHDGMPGSIAFSTDTAHDGIDALRPKGAFGIEAPTYTTLVRGLMWYGHTRLEGDGGSARSELALACTFIGATATRAAHLRLSMRLAPKDTPEVAEQAIASPGRLRSPLPDRVQLPATLAEVAVSLYTLRHLAGIACSTQPGKDATTGYLSLRQLGGAIERLAREHGEGPKASAAAEESRMLRRLRHRLTRTSPTVKGKEVVG